MRQPQRFLALTVCTGVWLFVATASLSAQQPPPPAPPGAEDAEVLTRGPIHEAFATPVGLDPAPGIVVPKQPPAEIEELPAEIRPDNPAAEWIGGYWSWDEERSDFIWISGIWRVPPQGFHWVAGYWNQTPEGYQRVSGFWAPIQTEEIAYLPPPPGSLENGPNVPAPSPNHFWVPGVWGYQDGRYVWRGGYWAQGQTNWVWVPAHYVWTPGGYVYVTGYWDSLWDARGVAYAPVYFHTSAYTRPNYFYRPSILLRLERLLLHLFVRPRFGTYYYGDYYGPSYASTGYAPWYAAAATPRYYDPIFTQQQWLNARTNPNWTAGLREQFNFYTANQNARPPRTLAGQQQLAATVGTRAQADNNLLAAPAAAALADTTRTARLLRIAENDRQALQQRAKEAAQFAQQRKKLEASAVAGVGVAASADRSTPTGQAAPSLAGVARTLKLPKAVTALSPVAGTPAGGAVTTPGPRTIEKPKDRPLLDNLPRMPQGLLPGVGGQGQPARPTDVKPPASAPTPLPRSTDKPKDRPLLDNLPRVPQGLLPRQGGQGASGQGSGGQGAAGPSTSGKPRDAKPTVRVPDLIPALRKPDNPPKVASPPRFDKPKNNSDDKDKKGKK